MNSLGDSGGPLWVTESVYLNGKKENRAYLVGIVSRGRDCANKDLPGTFLQIICFQFKFS